MRARSGEARSFIAAAVAYESDECLLWPFALCNGYGRAEVEGRVRVVSDIVCERVYGPRPGKWTEVHAAHSCNVKACVNKRHIAWRSKASNEFDKVAAGVSNRGERCGTHKLTEQQVLDIFADTRLQKDIAEAYGLRQQSVSDIKRGRNWGWLTKERI
jgi:hypothetical protein